MQDQALSLVKPHTVGLSISIQPKNESSVCFDRVYSYYLISEKRARSASRRLIVEFRYESTQVPFVWLEGGLFLHT